MNALILLLVLFAYMLNAFADAIDHGKGATALYELWHILKALSYGILICIILWQMEISVWVWALMLIALWLWWRFFYIIARTLEVWRWDDKVKIPLLCKIWELKQHAR